VQQVAEKAVHLKDDPNNHLNKPEQVNGLIKLALFQPIFYCGKPAHQKAKYIG
jgi:hypothetical protein